MMKKAVWMIALGTMSGLWGSQDMTIQVINAVYEKSITHAFDEKLKESGLNITKKVENGRYIVTLGKYKDEESARKDLEKVRTLVMKDAFIRAVDRASIVAATVKCAKPAVKTAKKSHDKSSTKVAAVAEKAHATKIAETKPEVKTAPVHTAEVIHETKAVAPAAEVKKEEPIVAAHEPQKSIAPAPVAVAAEKCPAPAVSAPITATPVIATVVLVDRNELRRQEIHDAIEYYKTSPYHQFAPVKMQP